MIDKNNDNANLENSNYDAIIIGSGIGGLTVASLLTKILKKKVLILERHSKLGGFTHSFGKKGKWRWDVGLHYVGDMHPKSTVRKLFDYISDKKIEWKNFPDPFQYYIYPDFKFAVPSSPAQYKSALEKLFPHEQKALVEYFHDLKTVTKAWPLLQLNQNNIIKKIILKFSAQTELLLTQTTKEYLDIKFKDNKLKALLDSQWGDLGLPQKKSPFYTHALLVSHYLRGAYYPKVGSHKIAESIMEVINTEGGEARNFSEVTEVLFDDMKSKVKGCRYLEKKNIQESGKESFKEVFAPLVISNAGARITYSKWIPASVNSEIAKKISNVPSGLSSLIVYIGFKESSAKLGIQGENYWIFSDYDHDKMAANCSLILDGKPQLAFVSFGSSHNPEIKNATAQIITFIEPHAFEKWKNTKYQNRGDDYKELKNNIALTLIDFVEKHIVGFKDLIEFVDVGTPLTVTHYTDQPYGEIYGLAGTQERYTILKNLGVETPIKNFYITGADVSMAGIAGALLGGVLTFAKIAFYDCLSPQLRRFITSYFYKKFRNKFLGQRK